MSIINTALIGKLKKVKADKENVLELDNTVSYIPTEEYHPSTKKYTDELISTSITAIDYSFVTDRLDALESTEHTHSNKAILDNITFAFTTELNAIVLNNESSLSTLTSDVSVNGSILHSIDNEAENSKFTSTSDLSSSTIKTALNELADRTSLINSDIKYSNETPMPEDVGGLETGDTFFEKTISEMFDLLLYPYQYPAISSFSISSQSTTLEVGDIVSGGNRTFNWSITNNSNIQTGTIKIQDLTNSVYLATGLEADGTEIVDIGSNISKNTAASHQFRIYATNTKGTEINRTYTINWRWRLYWGSSSLEELTETDIESLQNSVLTTTENATRNYNAGGYKYLVYPVVFGLASKFTDNDSGFAVAMEEPEIINITNNYGVGQDYYIYRSTNSSAQALNIKVG